VLTGNITLVAEVKLDMEDHLEEEIPEATVETVTDHIEARYEEPSTLDYIKYNVLGYFSNPWALLILLFLLYKLYRLVSPMITEPLLERWNQWQVQREVQAEAARYKKNPDEFKSKMEAMELARMRMQERYNEDAQVMAVKRMELEERKREQEIEEWENHQQGKGYKNRAKTGIDKEREALEQQARIKGKKGFKPDHNPLMGMGGGSGYRPAPRRGGASGGG